MTDSAIRRIVEAFFRRWPFYVLIFLVVTVAGLNQLSNTTETYTSSGQMFIDRDSLITDQSGVQDVRNPRSVAQFTGQAVGGLMTTDAFVEGIADRAGVELATAPAARARQLRQIRTSLRARATSSNLLEVSATTEDPELSTRLVRAAMEEFVQFQISIDIAESGAAEDFFTSLTGDLQEDLIEARRAVDLALLGISDEAEMTPREAQELERLQEAEVRASERFQEALASVEASQLATLQTESDVQQRYSIFDEPEVPAQPNGSVMDDIVIVAMFTVVGLVLMLVGPLASAIFNRSVLFPEDIEERVGLSVIGVVPRQRRKALDLETAIASADIAVPSMNPALVQNVPAQESLTSGVPSPKPKQLPAPAAQPTTAAEDEMSRAAWLAVTTTEFGAPTKKPASEPVAKQVQPPLDFLEAMLSDSGGNGASTSSPTVPAQPENSPLPEATETTDIDVANLGSDSGGGDATDTTPPTPDAPVDTESDSGLGEALVDDELFDLNDLDFDPWKSPDDDGGLKTDDSVSIKVPQSETTKEPKDS